MKTYVVLMLGLAAAAGAADMVSVGSTRASGGGGGVTPPNNNDATVELYYDGGTCTSTYGWYTGAGTWGGNQFSIATMTTYNYINSARLYYYPGWPNSTWEGNAAAIFAFSGGTPGSMISGTSRWVRGSGTVGGWQVYNLTWVIPATNQAFIFCYSQVYNYPGVDPVYPIASSGTGAPYSWYYYAGAWARVTSLGYGGNLMNRISVDNDHTAVTPSSFGRVKAMYH